MNTPREESEHRRTRRAGHPASLPSLHRSQVLPCRGRPARHHACRWRLDLGRQGQKLLDGMAGLWCVNVGYGRKELAEAAYRQMLELPYYNTFFKTTTVPATELAAKISASCPALQACLLHQFGLGGQRHDRALRAPLLEAHGQARAQTSSSAAAAAITARPWSRRPSAACRGCTSRAACRCPASTMCSSPIGIDFGGT